MVPHGDVDQVTRADAVLLGLIAQEFRRHLGAAHAILDGHQLRRDGHQLDTAAFRRTFAHQVAGVHVLARGEHTALQGEAKQHGQGKCASHGRVILCSNTGLITGGSAGIRGNGSCFQVDAVASRSVPRGAAQ
ncbi:hypothetical protein D9M69_508990 [compost metagenome]